MTHTVKPSDCPNYTVIDDPVYGLYIKEDFKLWTQVHPEENTLPYTVSDDGFEATEDLPDNFVTDKADEVFQDFEIRALPPGWRMPKIPNNEPKFNWWPIPGHPNYLIREDGVKIRNKRYGSRKAKNKARSGYFILYSGEEQTYWNEHALGDAEQIKHFLATGLLLRKEG